MTVSPEHAALVAKVRERPWNWNAPLPQMRSDLDRGLGEKLGPEIVVEAWRDGDVGGEWLMPPGGRRDRVVLYLHGGGYVMGSARSHRGLAVRIAGAAHAVALLPEYRLAPEHPFPAGLDDAVAAFRSLVALGHRPDNIVIAGDSAGGGLAIAATLALRDAGTIPAAVVAISPWTDLALSGASAVEMVAHDPVVDVGVQRRLAALYLGTTAVDHPLASPVHADFAGMPPMLLMAGSHEVLRDDVTRVAEKAEAAGVAVTVELWPEMLHAWPLYARFLPEARAAIERIGHYISERLPA